MPIPTAARTSAPTTAHAAAPAHGSMPPVLDLRRPAASPLPPSPGAARAPTAISTVRGGAIDLLDPQPGDFCIAALAEAAAKLNRFTGHTGLFYSVLQHSMLVADLLPQGLRAHALLHDLHEAVIGDDSSPKKRALRAVTARLWRATGSPLPPPDILRELEEPIVQALHDAAGLLWPLTEEEERLLKWADLTALATEQRDLMGHAPDPDLPPPHAAVIRPCPSWPKVLEMWLTRWTRCLPHAPKAHPAAAE